MFPILQLDSFAIQLPGLFLLAGVWIGTSIAERTARNHKLPGGIISNMLFIGLVLGILGARLWYAFRYLDVYLEDPLGLFSLNTSTLAPMEGVVTGLISALIYGQRKALPLWPTLDALTLPFAAMAIAIGFAHLSSGDAFGAPVDVPWAIELWGSRRHPSQVYEILLGVLAFIAAWRTGKLGLPAGITFLLWGAITAANRLFLEAFRGDSVIVLDIFRVAQLYSLTILLAAMWGMHTIFLRARGRPPGSS